MSLQRPGFDPRPVRVRFVVDKVAQGQVFCEVFRFFPVCITLPSVPYPSIRVTDAILT